MGLSGEHGQKDRRGPRRAPLSAVVKGTTVVRIAVVLEKGRKDPPNGFCVFVICVFAAAAFERTVMKASSIPMKASKAEVRAILPKGNEEQDNDDWAKFEVSAVSPPSHHRLFASFPCPPASSSLLYSLFACPIYHALLRKKPCCVKTRYISRPTPPTSGKRKSPSTPKYLGPSSPATTSLSRYPFSKHNVGELIRVGAR